HRALHSFPTRRPSPLENKEETGKMPVLHKMPVPRLMPIPQVRPKAGFPGLGGAHLLLKSFHY
ncbi:hypothetical protein, partial [Moorena sp. SIO2C4]|uniref:hypothetical protein n=1 Tax=Moorena sp. SIO2C4 TaxID=2607824 RepID=UPI002580F7FD